LGAQLRHLLIGLVLSLLNRGLEVAHAGEEAAHVLLDGLEVFVVGLAVCSHDLLHLQELLGEFVVGGGVIGIELRELRRLVVESV